MMQIQNSIIEFNVNVKKVPQRCCDLQHDARPRELYGRLQCSFEAIQCVGASSCKLESTQTVQTSSWPPFGILSKLYFMLKLLLVAQNLSNSHIWSHDLDHRRAVTTGRCSVQWF